MYMTIIIIIIVTIIIIIIIIIWVIIIVIIIIIIIIILRFTIFEIIFASSFWNKNIERMGWARARLTGSK